MRASICATTSAQPPPATRSRSIGKQVAARRIRKLHSRDHSHATPDRCARARSRSVRPPRRTPRRRSNSYARSNRRPSGPHEASQRRGSWPDRSSRHGPPPSATQTAPGQTAIPDGCGPTRMLAISLFVAGSTRSPCPSTGRRARRHRRLRLPSGGERTLIRATTAFLAGSIRMSVDSASLIAQTAPSPTANAPPPSGGGAPRPSGIRATTLPPGGNATAPPSLRPAARDHCSWSGRGRGCAHPGQRARCEAAHPDRVARGRERETGPSFHGRRDANGRTGDLPRANVDPGDGPLERIADEQVTAAAREPRRFAADSNRFPDRAQCLRVRVGRPLLLTVDDPDAPCHERNTNRETAAGSRLIALVRGSMRSSWPLRTPSPRRSRRRPRVRTPPGRQREGSRLRQQGERIESQERCRSDLQGPQVLSVDATGPTTVGNCRRARPARFASRSRDHARAGSAAADMLDGREQPVAHVGEGSPGRRRRYCAPRPEARSRRRSGRSRTGRCGSRERDPERIRPGRHRTWIVGDAERRGHAAGRRRRGRSPGSPAPRSRRPRRQAIPPRPRAGIAGAPITPGAEEAVTRS